MTTNATTPMPDLPRVRPPAAVPPWRRARWVLPLHRLAKDTSAQGELVQDEASYHRQDRRERPPYVEAEQAAAPYTRTQHDAELHVPARAAVARYGQPFDRSPRDPRLPIAAQEDTAAYRPEAADTEERVWPRLTEVLGQAASALSRTATHVPSDLQDLVVDAADGSLHAGDEGDLDTCLDRIKRIEGATAAIKARLIEVATRRQAHRNSGLTDTGAYLRERLGVSGREAKRQADLAQGLSTMDGAVDALAEGRLGVEQAGVLARAARDGRLGDGEQVQRELLETATTSTPEALLRTVKQREQAADKDALRRDENLAYARRRASISKQPSGMWLFRGELDPVNGEVVATAIRAFTTPDPAGTPPEQRRSTEKRVADGLVELAQIALRGDSAPEAGGTRPHVSLVVLADQPGTEAGEDGTTRPADDTGTTRPADDTGTSRPADDVGTTRPADDVGTDGTGEEQADRPRVPFRGGGVTESGTVLSPEATARLICDSALSRVIMRAPAQVLNVGRTERNWSAPQRRAIIARDGRCRGPGCDRPAAWCDIHHVRWWTEGGPSDLDNGLLLCRRHHRLVHEGGWGLTVEPATGRAVFVDRRGKEHATLPRGAPTLLDV